MFSWYFTSSLLNDMIMHSLKDKTYFIHKELSTQFCSIAFTFFLRQQESLNVSIFDFSLITKIYIFLYRQRLKIKFLYARQSR